MLWRTDFTPLNAAVLAAWHLFGIAPRGVAARRRSPHPPLHLSDAPRVRGQLRRP
jgi:hypothetical protein